jgi:hypothetical protein
LPGRRENCAIRLNFPRSVDDGIARRTVWIAIIGGVTLAAFVNALAVASRLAQTSDSAGSFVAGQAIVGGNLLLSGWRFPLDDYYFTDAVPYASLEFLVGSRPYLLVLVPALTWALFVLAALLVCVERERPFAANVMSAAAIALLLAAPPWMGLWNPLLLSDMHMATVLGAFVALALCARITDRLAPSLASCAVVVIIACATIASDPFAVVFAFGPALAILFVDVVAQSKWRGFLLLAAGFAAGFALPYIIVASGGFAIDTDIVLMRPQTPALLPHNLISVATGTLTLFGANPFLAGGELRNAPLLALRGGGLVLAVAALFRTARRAFARDQASTLDRMLLAGAVCVYAACAASAQFAKGITPENLRIGGPPMRYLAPGCLFVGVLAARRAPEILSGRRLRHAFVAAAGIVLVGGLWLSRLDRQPVWIADNAPARAARWLQQHGLSEGVGEYWSANLIAAMSGGAVDIRSIIPDGDRLAAYPWVENAREPARPPQFVIWRDDNKTGVTAGEVRRTYDIQRVATVADYRIALISSSRQRAPAPFAHAR